MNPLSKQEIMTLLETMDPAQIREQEKARLDDAARRLLDQLEARERQDPEKMLQDFGQQFREANPPPEASALPVKARSLWRTPMVPNWGLAVAAAVFFGFFFLPNLNWDGDFATVRSNSLDMEKIAPLNESLVKALIERADFLMDAGRRQGATHYFKEAQYDLLQAYELDPDNTRLLNLLTQVYEKLGDTKRAEEFFKKWEAAQDQE